MVTTYQIRNVLRVYGNQLKNRAILSHEGDSGQEKRADKVSISGEARRKEEILANISNRMAAHAARGNIVTE